MPDAEISVAIDPAHADGQNMLGAIAWKLGQYKEGLEFVRRAAELAPNNKAIAENYRALQAKYSEMSSGDAERGKGPTS